MAERPTDDHLSPRGGRQPRNHDAEDTEHFAAVGVAAAGAHELEGGPKDRPKPTSPSDSPSAPDAAIDGHADEDDIEAVCRRFRRAIDSGKPMSIESCIARWEEPERSKLLCELIAVELAARQAAGRDLDLAAFRRRFSHDADPVEEAIAQVQQVNTICPTVGSDRLKLETQLHRMRFLAEGGLGQVFLAEDKSLRRETAIKLIREDLVRDADSCEQFRLEAEVTGRLDHPGIPVVYGLGTTDGERPFYVMKYVRGTRLDRLIRQYHKQKSAESGAGLATIGRRMFSAVGFHRPTPMRGPAAVPSSAGKATGEDSVAAVTADSARQVDLYELLTIFISICHTIGYAHRRGILHRDIKPGNVIHGKYGETITIDWGLALPVARQGVFKDVAEQTLTPLSGRSSRSSTGCTGTPAFMSPEQAAGNVPLTPASDIFSLGTMLYNILTGNPPYQGSSVGEVRQKAIECDYPPIHEVAPDVPKPLQAVCRKAMSREISGRYKTTGELISDLHAILADQPVSAVPETVVSRLTRWTRHHASAVLSVLLLGLALTLGLVVIAMVKHTRLTAQEGIARDERSMREDGLRMAAGFAARTVAGNIDLAYRTLELAAADETLLENLRAHNAAAGESAADREESTKNLQSWLDTVVSERFPKMKYRAWFVMSSNGTTVARFPQFEGTKASTSVGRNFSFRDYFHGLGQDLPPASSTYRPLDRPHNSAVMFSTIDSQLTANFSVPIRDGDDVIGVLVITVDRDTFFNIEVHQPEAQQLLIVETRGYPLLPIEWNATNGQFEITGRPQWSAGVVIHHEDETFIQNFDRLVRLSPEALQTMLSTSSSAGGGKDGVPTAQLFPEDGSYREPVREDDTQTQWTAAYAPIHIQTRDDRVADTGWYVIVEQHNDRDRPPSTP